MTNLDQYKTETPPLTGQSFDEMEANSKMEDLLFEAIYRLDIARDFKGPKEVEYAKKVLYRVQQMQEKVIIYWKELN